MHQFTNQLIKETSPYLLQHAHNPVSWYPWSEEALQKAKAENKPILVSIGYAACHWCHVMERESFEDEATAKIMNDNFINIKIDREERPDLDHIYMDAVQAITGSGGWPLNVFLTPDAKPFYGGTYFPPQRAFNRPSWQETLNGVVQAFREKRHEIDAQAENLTEHLLQANAFGLQKPEEADSIFHHDKLTESAGNIMKQADKEWGGFGKAPKFPQTFTIQFLLRDYYVTGNEETLKQALLSLDKMIEGGIYDQAGGGFARYSTDTEWLAPHFEKMLYDNAQLVSLYSHAYQLTQNDFYKTIVTETISFVEKELTSPSGGFFSSLNADTESGEGEFYAWKENDFKKIIGDDHLLVEYFNVTSAGNWSKGNNILSGSNTPKEFASLKGQSPDQFNSTLNNAKSKLLSERNKRKKPAADTKILTAWNAMMIKGYTDAYFATGIEDYFTKALSIAKFLEKNMLGNDGRLKRNFKDGKPSISGFLDDYAWMASAFIKLYQGSFDIHWLTIAKRLTDHVIENFYNKNAGMFYYTALKESNLVVRKMEIDDNAIPSSNSIMAGVLYSLGVIYDNSTYTDISKAMLTSVSSKTNLFPVYHAQWCSLAGLFSQGTYEVVVMGKDAITKNKALQKKYLPDCVVMGETDEENLPLLENKLPENNTLIYVCTNKICKRPVENVMDALEQIK
jgi:uncharacterized protein YyaL (SSP411 family)